MGKIYLDSPGPSCLLFFVLVSDGQTLRWSQKTSTSWNSCPCAVPSSVGWSGDLILTNRIWQRWWDVFSLIISHKIVSSALQAHSLSCWLYWSKLPCFDLPCGEVHMARNRSPCPNNLPGTISCQQPHELGSESFPSQTFRWDSQP